MNEISSPHSSCSHVTIRPATSGDNDRIGRFIAEAYGQQAAVHKFPHRWHWQFVANPAAVSPSVWIAETDGRIVGQLGLQHCRIHLGGEQRQAAWGVDFYVLPGHRGRGIGHRLQRIAFESVPIALTLHCAPKARQIKQSLGWAPAGRVPIFRRFSRIRGDDVATLARAHPHHRLARVLRACPGPIAIAGTIAAATHRRLRCTQPVETVEISDMKELPASIDALWQDCRPRDALAVIRSSEYLAWRYCQIDGIGYHRWLATELDEPVGVMVARVCDWPERRRLRILEWFGSSERACESLLARALGVAERLGLPAVECATTDPMLQQLLRSAGFLRSSSFEPLACWRLAEEATTQWYATFGDHDVDQYAPVR